MAKHDRSKREGATKEVMRGIRREAVKETGREAIRIASTEVRRAVCDQSPFRCCMLLERFRRNVLVAEGLDEAELKRSAELRSAIWT